MANKPITLTSVKPARVASQERCKKPGRGLRSMRLMLCDGADSFWWCRFGVWAAVLGQLGRGFEQ
jgi:hypothetical protein